jgi:hypothetical protein
LFAFPGFVVCWFASWSGWESMFACKCSQSQLKIGVFSHLRSACIHHPFLSLDTIRVRVPSASLGCPFNEARLQQHLSGSLTSRLHPSHPPRLQHHGPRHHRHEKDSHVRADMNPPGSGGHGLRWMPRQLLLKRTWRTEEFTPTDRLQCKLGSPFLSAACCLVFAICRMCALLWVCGEILFW